MARLLVFALILFGVTAFAESGTLDKYVGRSLSRKAKKRLEKKLRPLALATFLPPCPPDGIWKKGAAGSESSYIALYILDLGITPGVTYGGIQLLDTQARQVKSWSFQLGWRNRLEGASVSYSLDYAADILLIQSRPVVNGRDIAKIYFTIRDAQLRLIRIESQTGALVPNHYALTNFEIGVAPPPAELKTGLHSSRPDEVLSALTVLGGTHRELDSLSPYAAAVERLLADPAIRERIRFLANSTHPWIREAAGQIAKW